MDKFIKILNIVILIVLIPVLIVSLIFIVKSYTDKNNVPSLFGYTPLIVLSGSMETEIYAGDLIIVKQINTSELKEGDVIAFYTDTTRGTIITHRIVESIEKNGEKHFITKGDNNDSLDISTVNENLVVGKYLNIRFAGLGNTAVFLQTPTGMITIISIPVGILIICQYIQNRKNMKELQELKSKNK